MNEEETTTINTLESNQAEILSRLADLRVEFEEVDKLLHDYFTNGTLMSGRRAKIKLNGFKLQSNKLVTELESYDKNRKGNK